MNYVSSVRCRYDFCQLYVRFWLPYQNVCLWRFDSISSWSLYSKVRPSQANCMLHITVYQVGVIDCGLRFGTIPCWISWSDGQFIWLLYSKVCMSTMSPGSVSRLFPLVLRLMTYNIYNIHIYNHIYRYIYISKVSRCYFLQSPQILGSFSKVGMSCSSKGTSSAATAADAAEAAKPKQRSDSRIAGWFTKQTFTWHSPRVKIETYFLQLSSEM